MLEISYKSNFPKYIILILFPCVKILLILLLCILLLNSFEISKNLGVFNPLKQIVFAVRTLSVKGDTFILSPVLPKMVSTARKKSNCLYRFIIL